MSVNSLDCQEKNWHSEDNVDTVAVINGCEDGNIPKLVSLQYTNLSPLRGLIVPHTSLKPMNFKAILQ